MNKRNIGVIVTSTALVGAALGGGIAAVVQAQNRSNAYAPTTIQKQRMSLLGSFLNDGDKDTTNKNPTYKGNPFAIYARAKIAEVVKKILKNNPDMLIELGYDSPADFDKVDNKKIISRMSLLRLEKNKDTILIMLSEKGTTDPKTGIYTPGADYKDRLLKLNMDITYDASVMQSIGGALNPFMVSDPKVSLTKLNPLSVTSINNVLNGLVSSDSSTYLSSMDSMIPAHDATKTVVQVQEEKSKSLIQSLILWQVYKIPFGQQSSISTVGELENKIPELSHLLSKGELKTNMTNIESRFNPFIASMGYFPLGIVVEDEAQLINSDMDLISTFSLKEAAIDKGVDPDLAKAATEKTFHEFEAATLLGLELFPDAQGGATIDISPRTHREYSALSNVQESSEIEEGSGNNVFQSALNNYDYFIKGDD